MRIDMNLVKFNNSHYDMKNSNRTKSFNSSYASVNNPNIYYYPLQINFSGSKPNEIELMKDIKDIILKTPEQDYLKSMNPKPSPNTYEELIDKLISLKIKNNGNHNVVEKQIMSQLDSKKIEETKKFLNLTHNIFSNSTYSKQERLNSFQIAYAFIDNNDILEEYLNTLDVAINKNHTIYFDNDNKKIFDKAKEQWSEKHLPDILKAELEKMIYIENVKEKCPHLEKLMSFSNLPLDDKVFVAQYYENNQYKEYDDEPLNRILKTRSIEDKSKIITEMRSKLLLDAQIFNEHLVMLQNLSDNFENASKLDEYKMSPYKSDNFSLLDYALKVSGQEDLIYENMESKIEYLVNLNKDEIMELTERIKKDWFEIYLPEKINKEVEYQTYITDPDVKIIDELIKINANLERIYVKLDKIDLSLSEFITNIDRIALKMNNPVEGSEKLQQQTALTIDNMKRGLSNSDEKQNKKVMESFKTEGIDYIDLLLKTNKDAATEAMLTDMKDTITREKRPSAVMARIEGIATMMMVNSVMCGARGSQQAALQHKVNSLTTPNTIDAQLSNSGVSDAGQGGLGLSALINPKMMIIAAVVIGLYGIYKSAQVHKEFSDMHFGEGL